MQKACIAARMMAVATAMLLTGVACGQKYPYRPIRIITAEVGGAGSLDHEHLETGGCVADEQQRRRVAHRERCRHRNHDSWWMARHWTVFRGAAAIAVSGQSSR